MSGVIFLGTGGGRRIVLSQLRRSGGFWLKLDDVNIKEHLSENRGGSYSCA